MKDKRKIIEIFVEENDDTTTFTLEKVEDSAVANETIRALAMIFVRFKEKEDSIELEYEGDDQDE